MVLTFAVGGAESPLASTTLDVAFTFGFYHELKLEVDGNSIKSYLDGVEKVSATNDEITGPGYAGLTLANGDAYFDDFERALP